MKNEDLEKILLNIETGYDLIADKFSSTRSFMWRDLGFVKDLVKPSDRVLDFGCGNGRLAGFLNNNYKEFVGVDISQKLIDIAKQKYSSEKTKFIKINPLFNRLPFDDNYFDVIFSIAVFHHLPGEEYRLKVAKELYRVLKPGGKLAVSVWNLWQRRFWKYHLEAIKNKMLGKSELDSRDLYISFKAGEKVFQRYHHAYTKNRIKKQIQGAGFVSINFFKTRWNLVIIGEKYLQ